MKAHRRLAAAPISWGICEVPGWGKMLPSERVLSEMTQLGIRATELGAPGFLPDDAAALARTLQAHGLRLVSSFVPVVVHAADATRAVEDVRATAAKLGGLGADVLSLALVEDLDWSAPHDLSDAEWAHVAANLPLLEAAAAEHAVRVAIHPHVGTVVETAAQIARALDVTTAGWCLDTGHLLVGGYDPAEFAQRHAARTTHVHLKDVDAAVAARLTGGELSLLQAVQAGLFTPLGAGDAGVARVIEHLDRAGYAGWLVLEQDTAITGPEPAVGSGPVLDVKTSIDFIDTLALTEERIEA